MSEEEENVPRIRNQNLLERIRQDGGNEGTQPGSGVSSGYVARPEREPRRGKREPARDTQGSSETDRGSARTQGTNARHDTESRQRVGQDKQAHNGPAANEGPRRRLDFLLKNPLPSQENTRLFNQAEVDDNLERMTEIYFRGSGWLDDVLQIITKGHEPVQIWQMELDEAQVFASMHLNRAKTDPKAAASARALLALYDRLHTIVYVSTRVKASHTYITEHGGLSFK